MAEDSKIEWTTHTFNPWRGCTKVSAGCANCYAETLSNRNPGTLGVWGPKGTRVVASEAMWKEPLKWDRKAKAAGERHRVFCASLADVFEDWAGLMVDAQGNRLWATGSDALPWMSGTDDKPPRREIEPLTMQDARQRLFRLIDATPNLDWLLLTKRPENVLRMTHDAWCPPVPGHVSQNVGDGHAWKFPPNVWIGTSVENQQAADERIPHLLRVPAAVRFLSMEPLLGPVNLRFWQSDEYDGRTMTDAGKGVHWVIVGGESGPGARPTHLDWARSIRDQCQAAGVAFHFKQWGEHLPIGVPDANNVFHTHGGYASSNFTKLGKKGAGRTLDGRTWDEFPEVPSC